MPSHFSPGSAQRRCVLFWTTWLLCVVGAPIASGADVDVDLADLSIEELMAVPIDSVYGASRYEQKVNRAPSSVTILDRDEIRRFGARSYAELLRSVRGVYVSDDRNYAYLGMRGFLRPGDYNTRTLLMIDGHRLNENIYDAFYLDEGSLPELDLVQSFEVVRGPGSSVYGSNAFFGVINVIPRTGGDIDGMEISGAGGNLGQRQARLTYGTTWGRDGDLLVSTSFLQGDGNRRLYFPEFDPRISDDPRAANDGWVEGADGERATQLYVTAAQGGLKLSVFGSSRRREIPTAPYETVFNAGAEWSQDDRAYLDLRWDATVADDTHLQVRGYADGYRYLGAYPYLLDEEDASAGVYLNRDEAYGVWTGVESHLMRRIGGRHTVLLGAEYRANLRQDMINYNDTEPREYLVDWRQRSSVRSLYAEAEVAVGDAWWFTGGVRYDSDSGSDADAVCPRVAAIVTPWTGGTAKLLYGSAFRAPNVYEIGYLEGGDELQEEQIDTYEAVLEQYWEQGYRAALSAYRYNATDLIAIGGDDSAFQSVENVGRTTASGVEAEIEVRAAAGAILRASAALQHAEDRTTGEELSNSPQQLFKGQILLPLGKRATAGIDLQYNSAVRTITGDRVPSFWLTHLTLFQTPVAERFTISASVYNLFNQEYGYPGSTDHLQSSIAQNRRTYRVKFECRF